MLDPQARQTNRPPDQGPSAEPTPAVPDHEWRVGKPEAAPRWRVGFLLHFFAHMGLVADAEPMLAQHGFGRTHHRILYFAHFAPGITVGELLEVLRLTHQSAQRALRQLHQEGYIEFRLSKADRRLKLLHCTQQGDELLSALTVHQNGRVTRAFEQSSSRDVQGYFAVLGKMIDPDDLQWIERLQAVKE